MKLFENLNGETEVSSVSAEADPDYLDRLIDTEAAAAFLDLSPRTLESHRVTGRGPMAVYLSRRCVKYRRRDLIAWVNARVFSNTTKAGNV